MKIRLDVVLKTIALIQSDRLCFVKFVDSLGRIEFVQLFIACVIVSGVLNAIMGVQKRPFCNQNFT